MIRIPVEELSPLLPESDCFPSISKETDWHDEAGLYSSFAEAYTVLFVSIISMISGVYTGYVVDFWARARAPTELTSFLGGTTAMPNPRHFFFIWSG